MKKIALLVALVVMTIIASAQTKQYFWLDGKLMFGTQIASTDSLTYGEEDTDSIWLYLPRTVIRTVHDTVIQTVTVHDTITLTVAVHDTVTQIAHDTVYLACDAGALTGRFSVSANTTVQFSKGNLQYQASTDTWRFAENQYDTIGAANTNISQTYNGWIDLFGWGTGNNPTKTSTTNSDYSTFVDWGSNAISNGGNTAYLWRSLTEAEWVYLLTTRANAESLFGIGNINGVCGSILLPDSWVLPSGISFTSNRTSYEANSYTIEQWSVLEDAGAVFLPAAGIRCNNSYKHSENETEDAMLCIYWSSTADGAEYAYSFYIKSSLYNPHNSSYRLDGQSVRLVR